MLVAPLPLSVRWVCSRHRLERPDEPQTRKKPTPSSCRVLALQSIDHNCVSVDVSLAAKARSNALVMNHVLVVRDGL